MASELGLKGGGLQEAQKGGRSRRGRLVQGTEVGRLRVLQGGLAGQQSPGVGSLEHQAEGLTFSRGQWEPRLGVLRTRPR